MSTHGQTKSLFFCIESGIDQIALQRIASQRGGKSMAKQSTTGSAASTLRVQYKSSTGEFFINGVRMGVFEDSNGGHPDPETISKAVRSALNEESLVWNWANCRVVNNLTGQELRKEDSYD